MLNTLKIAVLLAASLGFNAAPAFALQTSLKQVDKNADSNTSYRLSIKLGQGETLNRPEKKSPADFITVYSFSGLIEGQLNLPQNGSSPRKSSGGPPTLNGYPLVLPVDVPNTPSLTSTVTKAMTAGAQVNGFTAVTRVGTMVQREYSAQVTHQSSATKVATGTSSVAAAPTKQALIGLLPTPSFLADVQLAGL